MSKYEKAKENLNRLILSCEKERDNLFDAMVAASRVGELHSKKNENLVSSWSSVCGQISGLTMARDIISGL